MRTISSARLKSFSRIRRRRFKGIVRFLCGVIVTALLWSRVPTPRVAGEKAIRLNDANRFATTFPDFKPNVSVPVQYTETRFNGFGSQFLRLIDAAVVAHASHSRFDIIEGRYWNYGCAPYRGWSCYFKHRRVPSGSCTDLARWPAPFPACIRVSSVASMRRAAALLSHTSNGTVTMSRQLAKRLWKLNRHTEDAVVRLLRKSGVLDLEGEYIGVHVRRGDKRVEVADVPLQKYVQAVECIGGNLPVFVATDDGAILTELRTRLVARLVTALPGTEFRTGHFQIHVNNGYMKQNRGAVTALLADVTALKDAKWFIGTFSSNFARMVHVLREAAPPTSISLDDRWSPGVAWRTFGKPYCLSADANKMYCRCRELNQN